MEIENLKSIANLLRRDSLISTTSAGSGHPTSCLSCAEIISVLFFKEMSYDIKNHENSNNDEFILSKGHASPILYSALIRAKCIKNNIKELRKLDSNLQGHPIPNSLPWIKVATGSLGQGLSVGVGMALAGKLQNKNFRTYVLLGDSEMVEGSNYEALQIASYYNLKNLCVIIDVNRLGQRGETMLSYNLEKYKKRIESFGWETKIINGNKIEEIVNSLEEAKNSSKPFAIIAKTTKGKGVSFLENKEGWHGKALNQYELEKALKEIPESKSPEIKIKSPEKSKNEIYKLKIPESKNYKLGELISTRKAYGDSLSLLSEINKNILVLDAEVSNSTFSDEVKLNSRAKFIECFIAEQNMISMALGLSKKGFNIFASTFSCFLSRAHDQLRMASLSNPNLTIIGSHSGVSIGQDGASQMGLEDISMFRSLPNSVIFYPSDAVSTQSLVNLSSQIIGLKYIRTTRGGTSVIYNKNEKFPLGDFKILKSSEKDKLVLVGAGITLHECLKAHEILKQRNVLSSVVDLYCIKPLNSKKLIEFIKSHGNKLIISEDHYKEGGIGEMLSSELKNSGIKIIHLSIKEIPHSGTPEELLEKYRIDSKAIVKSALSFR